MNRVAKFSLISFCIALVLGGCWYYEWGPRAVVATGQRAAELIGQELNLPPDLFKDAEYCFFLGGRNGPGCHSFNATSEAIKALVARERWPIKEQFGSHIQSFPPLTKLPKSWEEQGKSLTDSVRYGREGMRYFRDEGWQLQFWVIEKIGRAYLYDTRGM